MNDPRASTPGAFLRVLAEARPKAFLLVNVEGLGFRGKDEGLRLIHAQLAAIDRTLSIPRNQ
jgi:DNA (cytosine-5)-methyltransferase 1